MTPKELILRALKRAEMSKNVLYECIGVPFGPLGFALDALILEGKVEKHGVRYRLKLKEKKVD